MTGTKRNTPGLFQQTEGEDQTTYEGNRIQMKTNQIMTETTDIRIISNTSGDEDKDAYLTAYKESGDDWNVSTDYMVNTQGGWFVAGELSSDEYLTEEMIYQFNGARERAQGVADLLNDTDPLMSILRGLKQYREELESWITEEAC